MGNLDALVFVAAKRNDLFHDISFAEADRAALRFLPIPAEGTGAEGYAPAQITHADYPDLVNLDHPISARAAKAVLTIIAWKPSGNRHAAAVRFVDLFFGLASQLVQPNAGFSAAWCQADIGGIIPGWERFDAADKRLAQHPGSVRKLARAPGSASATRALNSAEYRFRLPVIGSVLLVGRTKLNHLSEERAPSHFHK